LIGNRAVADRVLLSHVFWGHSVHIFVSSPSAAHSRTPVRANVLRLTCRGTTACLQHLCRQRQLHPAGEHRPRRPVSVVWWCRHRQSVNWPS